jgi:3'-5' exonuclease
MFNHGRLMLTIDIETAPTGDPVILDRLRADLKPPGNYKKEESIAEWYRTQGNQALKERVDATALRGMAGDVIAVGIQFNAVREQNGHIAFDPYEPRVFLRETNERVAGFLRRTFDDLLEELPPYDVRWVAGHNVAGFDLPFLWQQFVRHSVAWPRYLPILPNAWDERVLDTMTSLVGARNTVSLQEAAHACGIDWDDQVIPSADVPHAWLANDMQLVRQHLLNDILATNALATRILTMRS